MVENKDLKEVVGGTIETFGSSKIDIDFNNRKKVMIGKEITNEPNNYLNQEVIATTLEMLCRNTGTPIVGKLVNVDSNNYYIDNNVVSRSQYQLFLPLPEALRDINITPSDSDKHFF